MYVEPEPAPASKRSRAKRTPKAEVDPSQSLSVDNLPDWIRDDFDDFIIPTLLDHYGSQDDPWTLEPKKLALPSKTAGGMAADESKGSNKPKSITEVLDYLIETLIPGRPRKFTLEPKDRLVRIVCHHLACAS